MFYSFGSLCSRVFQLLLYTIRYFCIRLLLFNALISLFYKANYTHSLTHKNLFINKNIPQLNHKKNVRTFLYTTKRHGWFLRFWNLRPQQRFFGHLKKSVDDLDLLLIMSLSRLFDPAAKCRWDVSQRIYSSLSE